jgi:hypothetical protein
MGATKKWLIQMREEEFINMPSHLRANFISEKVIYDDYEQYKDNDQFKALYKAKKKAAKALDDWKYDQRHNFKR